MDKGPFKIINRKEIYTNPWITVQEDTVIGPDSSEGIFGTVDNGTGISVVTIDDNHNIYLIREYYYVLEEYGIQTPSGAIETGQTPIEAAKEELKEETGINADKWIDLGLVNPLTMIIKSPAYMFLARDLSFGKKQEVEIEVIKMPFKQACQMVMKSEITHGPSCLAILKAREKL